MAIIAKPARRPVNSNYSSGPCAKHPGWSLDGLRDMPVGRSHRATVGKAKLKQAIDLSREILGVPKDYRIGIVPASDTGAVEMAMWTMLGQHPVDVLYWESFSEGWAVDAEKELRIPGTRILSAPYGELPDLKTVNWDHDVVFPWNGTTAGVRVPNGDWIPSDRRGLTICDATSAAFAVDLPWDKLDATTYSWQKVMGSEAAHGMLILSPRAIERLQTFKPSWPIPKVFRLVSGGKVIEPIFEGETINTPSMLAVEDYLDALKWGKSIGGLKALCARSDASAKVLADWVARTPWVEFLAKDPATRSNTSICLMIVDPDVKKAGPKAPADVAKGIVKALETEKVAFDFGSYRDAPPGLRIWTGATIEASDIAILTEWLDWAFAREKAAVLGVAA
jgi:phosphoserine aminotransferase